MLIQVYKVCGNCNNVYHCNCPNYFNDPNNFYKPNNSDDPNTLNLITFIIRINLITLRTFFLQNYLDIQIIQKLINK